MKGRTSSITAAAGTMRMVASASELESTPTLPPPIPICFSFIGWRHHATRILFYRHYSMVGVMEQPARG
jgi:hypothetical protein